MFPPYISDAFCVLCFAAVSEAVQKWRTEKESRVQQEEEEEESIYTVHNEEVNLSRPIRMGHEVLMEVLLLVL